MIKVSDLQILIKYVFRLHFVHNGQKNSQYFTAVLKYQLVRAETKALIGGGGAYSYIRVLPDEFLLKSTVMTTDFKRNSSGRTRIYEYTPPQLML